MSLQALTVTTAITPAGGGRPATTTVKSVSVSVASTIGLVLTGGGGGTVMTGGTPLTTVKASGATSYQAAAETYVAFDGTAGPGPIYLPNAPPDTTQVGVTLVAGSLGSIQTSGADTFSTGELVTTLTAISQSVLLQYTAASQQWFAFGSYIPLSTLAGLFISSVTPNVVGNFNADTLSVDGIAGQTTRGRFLGFTASGAPADNGDGTFQPGDYVFAMDRILAGLGSLIVCVSPGSWSGGGIVAQPVATTLPADLITDTSVELNGTVNPNYVQCNYQFQYGTTTAYGSVSPTSPVAVGAGALDVPESAVLSSLSANTDYHYRLNAIVGTSSGVVQKKSNFSTTASGTISVGSAQGWVAPTAGNAILVIAANKNGITTIVGPAGFTQVGTQLNNTNCSMACFIKESAAGTETTLTVTNTAQALAIEAYEIHGQVAVSCIDGSTTASSANTAVSTLTSTAFTPTTASTLLISSLVLNGAARTFANLWTNGFARDGTMDSHEEWASLSTTSQSAISTTESWTGGTSNAAMLTVAVKLTAGSTTTINGADAVAHTNVTPLAPVIVQNDPTSITQTGATLSGTINPEGQNVDVYEIQYGLTTAYGSTVTLSPAPGSGIGDVVVSGAITGLSAGTGYHCRLHAHNATGDTFGADLAFTTLPATPPPTVFTDPASAIASTSAVLNGRVNPNGLSTTAQMQYGLTTGYGSTTPLTNVGSGSALVAVQPTVTGLTGATTYHFRLVGVSSAGTTNGPDQTFTTLPSGIAPVNTSRPTISGTGVPTPAVGAVLTCSTGTWTGTPTPTYTYQWTSAGTPIIGATSASYTTQAADAGLSVGCIVTATNSAGSASATNQNTVLVQGSAGTLTFSAPSSAGITPWSAAGGGMQAANYGTPSIAPRWRGDAFFGQGPFGGRTAIQLENLVPADPVTYTLTVVNGNSGVHNYATSGGHVVAVEEYIGFALWVPAGGLTVPCSGGAGSTNIGEWHMSNIGGQPPVAAILYSDGSIQLYILWGSYSSATGFQYSDHKNIPLQHLVPVGGLVQNAWNSFLIHAIWSDDPTVGVFQAWWRPQGAAWTQQVNLSGYPTIAYNAGSLPATWSDNPLMNYSQHVTSIFSLYFSGTFKGTSFAVVAAELP